AAFRLDTPIDVLRACAYGDQRAWRILEQDYSRRLHWHAVKFRLKDREPYDAVQDSWIRVVRNLPQFRAECSVSTWLTKISQSSCMDAIRKKQDEHHADLEELLAAKGLAMAMSRQVDVPDQLFLLEALFQLSEKLREVLIQVDYLGFPI